MLKFTTVRTALVALLLVLLPMAAIADTVTIPAGTTIYCVLDQNLSTKRKSGYFVQQGDRVRALVAEDVVIDGHVVIAAGTVVWSEVSKAKRAKIAGVKGKLEIRATTVNAVDKTSVVLFGGYDRSGKGRIALAAALTAVVAWPLIFIKGKQANLQRGVIFDAQTAVPVNVEIETRSQHPVLRPDMDAGLAVSIPYDEIDPRNKIRTLPLKFEGVSIDEATNAAVVAVNGEQVPKITFSISDNRGAVDFKALSKHFRQGMNRFTIEIDEEIADVLLEIEF